MNRCFILGVFFFFFCQANAFEIGGNMLTYFITTHEGKNMTLYITPRPEITIQGKAYMSFSGYFTNNTEENYVENLILLRRDGAQYFCYDSKTESEHLVFDFGLQKGDSYIDDFNNIEYEVTDVRDTLLYDQSLQLIELQSKGGEGKRDIWVESIGSIYNGILPTNDYCKEMFLLINEYYLDSSEEFLEYLCRFYPNNQYIKTADMDITYLQWEKELETDEDWEEYLAWYNAPTDLNAEFSGDTLHVWGRLRASGGLYPYAACEIQGNIVSLCFYSNIYSEGICIDEIDTRIPGFQKGEYLVNLINRTQELECKGNTPTSVKNISIPSQKNILFDLQGRKVQGKPSQGIYIENGQKKVKR